MPSATLRDVHVTVTAPAGNVAPVASFTASCSQNVCGFDGRASTDENAPTLTYSWNFGNVAPTPVINQPACTALVCNISGVGSADPNTGDTFGYLWNFGDGTPTGTSSAMSHTFPAAGSYTVTLTVTDGWGKAATTTRQVTVTAT